MKSIIGIGGSFAKEDMSTAVKWVNEILPENKPRHLLGIGEPEDLFMGVENGVDLFDCVGPTRIARNGTLFTKKGKIVQTTSLSGYLQLYFIAGLRRRRRKSLRYQREHQQINDWLAHIPTLARENYALALEFAECPRMLKGYGDTHLHGKQSFDAVMRALPKLRCMEDAAGWLKKLREAALADDTGQKLAETLREVPA